MPISTVSRWQAGAGMRSVGCGARGAPTFQHRTLEATPAILKMKQMAEKTSLMAMSANGRPGFGELRLRSIKHIAASSKSIFHGRRSQSIKKRLRDDDFEPASLTCLKRPVFAEPRANSRASRTSSKPSSAHAARHFGENVNTIIILSLSNERRSNAFRLTPISAIPRGRLSCCRSFSHWPHRAAGGRRKRSLVAIASKHHRIGRYGRNLIFTNAHFASSIAEQPTILSPTAHRASPLAQYQRLHELSGRQARASISSRRALFATTICNRFHEMKNIGKAM